MTATILLWIAHLAERDLSAMIGLFFIGLSGVVWYIQKENRIGNGLNAIADAIKEQRK